MSTESYRFKLGDFECVSISDGSHDYPVQDFFANVPKEQIEELLRQRNLPTDHITTPYTYLFVNTREHRVLVDMGAGNLFPTTGRLVQNMKAAGIEPAEIDTVIITHAHPDHIGGALDEEGNPVFPSARYYIWRDEWDFWFSKTAFAKAPEISVKIARKNLEPIKHRVSLLSQTSSKSLSISVVTLRLSEHILGKKRFHRGVKSVAQGVEQRFLYLAPLQSVSIKSFFSRGVAGYRDFKEGRLLGN